jgi:periplasmic protein TonB
VFEDSVFESAGTIRTRSRQWMMAAFTFNGSIVLALIMIPLIHPAALPIQMLPISVEAPPLPAAPDQLPPQQLSHAAQGATSFTPISLMPPRLVPVGIPTDDGPIPPTGGGDVGVFDDHLGIPFGIGNGTSNQRVTPVVVLVPKGPVRLPSKMVEGMIIRKTIPVYPQIGIAIRKEGTVVLQATISKSGTIENLRVLSGPPILQQAAMDAVKTWQYKPYLLNDEPVEVETTVNVVFSLNR